MRHFTVAELSATSTGINNVPTPEAVKSLTTLVDKVLDPARDAIGAIRVTSGYRCERLNKAVGGASTSQHVKGEAADITCADNRRLFEFIRDNLEFDQLIWEKGNSKSPAWVHVSFREGKNRKQILKIK